MLIIRKDIITVKTEHQITHEKKLERDAYLARRMYGYKRFAYEKSNKQHEFYLNNIVASIKTILLLLMHTQIFNTRATLYELARMIAPENHNTAVHRSIDDDHQNDGVSTSFTSSQMESNK